MTLSALTVLVMLLVTSEKSATLVVPNVGLYTPTSTQTRTMYGSSWIVIGLRNRLLEPSKGVTYAPDTRLIASPVRSPQTGNAVMLFPAQVRATVGLSRSASDTNLSMFAAAGLLGVWTSGTRSRYTMAPMTSIGFGIVRGRFDFEAVYYQPQSTDGYDYSGLSLGVGLRL